MQITAPPKVTNLKIIGELKEGSKVSVTGIVTGGTEASSRVQWFKTSSSTFEDEDGVEALSTSKIAKVRSSELHDMLHMYYEFLNLNDILVHLGISHTVGSCWKLFSCKIYPDDPRW